MTSMPETAAADPRLSRGLGGLFFGVYPAVVTDVRDPGGMGAVKVRLPWSPDAGNEDYEVWARIATLLAGPDRGSWFVPDVDDEVLVAFGGGDPRRPFVVGALWNGQDSPPESMDSAGNNDLKVLKTRSGVRIAISDASGSESVVLETPAGQRIALDDGERSVTAADASGNTVTLDSSGVTVTASGTVSVQASTVDVSAGSVSVNAGMSTFSGVVKADTLIATTVVASTYTPGAGNIW